MQKNMQSLIFWGRNIPSPRLRGTRNFPVSQPLSFEVVSSKSQSMDFNPTKNGIRTAKKKRLIVEEHDALQGRINAGPPAKKPNSENENKRAIPPPKYDITR